MSIVEVRGARLYYEVRGSGPTMVTIPGSPGTADIFKRLAAQLENDYTVVAYDRRGFSRSELTGAQDYDRRLDTDVDDVRRLLEHVDGGPAIVFGGSSGAIVALELLIQHPSLVRTLVPFEPPAVRLLTDGQEWLDRFVELYGLYHEVGLEQAVKHFREQTFAPSDGQAWSRLPRSEFTVPNAQYWFEHELRQYPPHRLDLDALRANADRILLAAGQESRGHPCYEVNIALGRVLGREVIELPGGHVGYADDVTAEEFGRGLQTHLARMTRPIRKERPMPQMRAPLVLPPGGGTTIEGPVGGPMTFKVRGEDSNGTLTVIENAVPPGQGPPVHTHANEDESWYVLEGELRFKIDEEDWNLPAGSFVFVPVGTTYTFQNVSSGPTRILVILTPAGLEQFFERTAEIPAGTDIMEAYTSIGREFGVGVVAPPLSARSTSGTSSSTDADGVVTGQRCSTARRVSSSKAAFRPSG